MQGLQDIFGRWPSISALAEDINENYDTVLRWRIRGRIPEDAWPKLIERSAANNDPVTAEDLLAFNAPIKKRGRPPGAKNRPKVVRPRSRRTSLLKVAR